MPLAFQCVAADLSLAKVRFGEGVMMSIASVAGCAFSADADQDVATRVLSWFDRSKPSFAGRRQSGDAIGRLIAAGAWTDATLALMETELPQWRVRRLSYDDGEWHCALSRNREMPDWLDQSVDGHHPQLPLAILNAFDVAKQQNADRVPTSVPSVLYAAHDICEIASCDNYR